MTSTALDTSPPSPEAPGNRALFRSAAASPPRTLVDVLAATAARHPDAPALDTGGQVLSYRELCAEARTRALRLTERGIGPGDRVGIRVPSGTAELYLSILAILHCGAAYAAGPKGITAIALTAGMAA
ncbi:AMP-binding protein, partial [Streptomyces sp. NPDC003233]